MHFSVSVIVNVDKSYVGLQLSAFAVLWAKSYLTEFVERHIMFLDGGEEPEEASSTEDSEAVPTPSDPWLLGCTPVVTATPQHPTSLKQVLFLTGSTHISNVSIVVCVIHITTVLLYFPQAADVTQAEKQTPAQSTTKQQCEGATQITHIPPQQHQREAILSSRITVPPLKLKEKKLNSTSPRLPVRLLPPITTSAKREEVKVKHRKLSAPQSTTGSLHQLRNQRPIPKLDPSCLPQLCVFPQHAVLDNIQPTKCQKPSGRLSQLTKLEPVREHHLDSATSSRDLSGTFLKRDEADLSLGYSSISTYKHSRERTGSSGRLSLEKIKLAEGVSLLDPDNKIYLPSKLPSLSTKLNPIQSDAALPLYSVEQVIAGPPQVKPLIQPQN